MMGSISPVGSDRRAARSCGPRERSERRLGAPGRPAPKGGAPEQRNPVLPFRRMFSNPKSGWGRSEKSNATHLIILPFVSVCCIQSMAGFSSQKRSPDHLFGMLNPCITINYKITKLGEARCKAKCDAHLKSKSEINHVARVKSYSISI